jgi:hypothetical protein
MPPGRATQAYQLRQPNFLQGSWLMQSTAQGDIRSSLKELDVGGLAQTAVQKVNGSHSVKAKAIP